MFQGARDGGQKRHVSLTGCSIREAAPQSQHHQNAENVGVRDVSSATFSTSTESNLDAIQHSNEAPLPHAEVQLLPVSDCSQSQPSPQQAPSSCPLTAILLLDHSHSDLSPLTLVTPSPMIADAQLYLVDVDVLREILTTFWVPFLQSGVHAWSHTVVPMTLIKAQPFDRWHELAKWFADPCCLHTADLVRLSALSFGVWKIVSKNKMDRSRSTALYVPRSLLFT